MVSFVLRRFLLALPVLFGASLALFALLYVLPGDPASFVLGDSATPAQLAALRHRLDLDQPVPVQYVLWLARLMRGDLRGNNVGKHVLAATHHGCTADRLFR